MKQETGVCSCGTKGSMHFHLWGGKNEYVMLHLPLLLSNQEGHLGLAEWVEAV